jgi:maltose 6'-phosphate phosphatase
MRTTQLILSLKAFTICLLIAATGCVSKKNQEPVSLRVAAYNVEFSKSATPEQIGEMFKSYNLDIIGFNEVPNGDWTDRVGKVLGMKYSYVGKISSANHKDKYKSILSRIPIKYTAEHQIKGTGWNPSSAVKAVIDVDGIEVAFYSLHICKSRKATGHAYNLAYEILPKETVGRVIVAGDFNGRIGEYAMNVMEESGMTPTWKDLKTDLSTKDGELFKTYTYNALDPERNAGVIDHIFYNASSGASTSDGGIIELEKALSDHKPIWAEIVFPREINKK